MAHGENLAGDFEVSATNQTRRTQTAMYLRGFENRGMQLGVVLLKRGQFDLQLKPQSFVGALQPSSRADIERPPRRQGSI